MTCGAFTGTLDFSANNNSVTLTATGGFSGSGAGTRTINLGNGTWTMTGTGTVWNVGVTTGLTFNANSSTVTFSATSATTRNVALGSGLTYSTVTVGANTSGGMLQFSSAGAAATLNISAPNYVAFNNGTTQTVTNSLNINGTSLALPISIVSNQGGATATISSANNGTFTNTVFRDVTFTGGGTFSATSSIDQGHNAGITITAPSAGGGGISRARAASGF